MRINKICCVKGCGRPYTAKDMCSMHYQRFKRNGTVNVITEAGDPIYWLLNIALKHKIKNKCLIWPYGRNSGGYGYVLYKNKKQRAHRIACQKTYGKAPTKRHQALHSCGKGHEGCVNPHHLYWGTPKDNRKDTILHGMHYFGEKQHLSKLTDSKVRKIIRLINLKVSDAAIALKFRVNRTTIRSIRRGKTWKHVNR